MPYSKLKRSLHRQVVDQLGRRIVGGQIQVGETLPNEADLSAELGVSRTVTREAIKVLGEKGLVIARPKVGTLVQPRSKWNQLDPDVLTWEYEVGPRDGFLLMLTEVRRIIEPAAAKLAAERATEANIAAIAACYDDLERCADDYSEQYIPTDIRFHSAIVRASQNELLEQLVNTIRAALVSSRKVTTQVPGGSRETLPLHYAVYDAIRRRQPAEAYQAMCALIDRAAADIHRVLGTPGG